MSYASVIVTYNRKALLLDAVKSVLAQKPAPTKVILIDNHSTDGTEELVRDSGILRDQRVRYTRLAENIGGSGGFHVGVKLALEYPVDWISLSDDDAIFESDYFANIFAESRKHPDILAYSGSIQLEDGRIQLDQRNRITNWNYFSHSPVPKSEYKDNFEIDLFTFCGCVINRQLIDKIGLPKGDYFIWYDDIEYSLRVRQYTKILNVVNSIIVHHTNWIDVRKEYPADWREYYWIRNRAVTVRELGKNRIVVNLWSILLVPRMAIRILTQKMYKGKRWHAIKVHLVGMHDAFVGKMGKSQEYRPGAK